jgi:hypothetical protein
MYTPRPKDLLIILPLVGLISYGIALLAADLRGTRRPCETSQDAGYAFQHLQALIDNGRRPSPGQKQTFFNTVSWAKYMDTPGSYHTACQYVDEAVAILH